MDVRGYELERYILYLRKVVIAGVARQLHARHAQGCKLLFPIVAAFRAEGLARVGRSQASVGASMQQRKKKLYLRNGPSGDEQQITYYLFHLR